MMERFTGAGKYADATQHRAPGGLAGLSSAMPGDVATRTMDRQPIATSNARRCDERRRVDTRIPPVGRSICAGTCDWMRAGFPHGASPPDVPTQLGLLPPHQTPP